jgi:hypothetical protein
MVAAAALALAACESPVTYHPATKQGGAGYADQQLAGNRWRVTFTGNSATRREAVENYLLLRSAEVTLKAGYHWFIFDNRNTEAQTTYHSDFIGLPGWRGRGWYWHSWPGWGADEDVTSRPITTYDAYAEIVLLTDEQAKNEPRAIKAQDVLDHIGPSAYPPAPGSPPPQP